MRHLFLTLLITLSFLPSRHHIFHTGVFKYDIYDDKLIEIMIYEHYDFSQKYVAYNYKNVDGHRRFKSFFEFERFGLSSKLSSFNGNEEFNYLVGIAEAFNALSQDSIARIEPGLPFGTLCLYYEEPEEMPYIPGIPICEFPEEFPEPDESVDIQEEYRKLLEEEGFDFIFERIL